MARMKDVALAANVSLSTVSHVLNGTRKVDAATAAAVKNAINRIGFVPNTLARALAGAASSTIGVAISALSNHYFSETVRGIESECAKHGLLMFFADTHDDPQQELRVVQGYHQRQVDGLVLAPARNAGRKTIEYLQQHKIPTVLVDRSLECDLDQVGVENKAATIEIVSHLIEMHGHRRIGFVSGASGFSTTDERLEGYRTALAMAGLPFDRKLVRSGESCLEPARQATCSLLRVDKAPTAIMAANGLMTIGAMHALRDANVEVPAQMALVGFDDFDWANYFKPRLTVVAQPLEALGVRSIQLLIDRLRDSSREQHIVKLKPTLQIRNSCGCP